MIPAAHITDWERRAPWPTREQIEQDLLLSRLIIEIANDEYLGDEFVFRGGTCLHKLHLPARPALQRRPRLRAHHHWRLRAPFETGVGTMSVKIEVNTFERSPARPLQRVPFSIDSLWFTSSADVLTFDGAELVATKIRALYQRSNGRDLIDLWLALVQLVIEQVIARTE